MMTGAGVGEAVKAVEDKVRPWLCRARAPRAICTQLPCVTRCARRSAPLLSLLSPGTQLWPTLKVNWLVWPGLTAFNLGLVPPPYRILFINFCSLGWSAFLSNMANKPAAALEPVAAAPPPPPARALA